MTKKYSGGYKMITTVGRCQIWRTPRGRFSIYTPDGVVIKSNLGSFDIAVQHLKKI